MIEHSLVVRILTMHFGVPGIIAKLLTLGMLWGDGAFICQIGGPAYRIGMGGGAASSMVSLLYTLSRMVLES
jgi:phosphoribosylformylglycinamidine (FGAM) synthase-like enzyme